MAGRKNLEDRCKGLISREEYKIKEYDIKGYTLKEIIGNKSGIFLKNKSNITYIYEPDIPSTSITKIELLTSIITLIFILILKKC